MAGNDFVEAFQKGLQLGLYVFAHFDLADILHIVFLVLLGHLNILAIRNQVFGDHLSEIVCLITLIRNKRDLPEGQFK